MKIILVRHAKAEDKREDLDDIKRHLTKKGKEKFNDLIPKLKHKLRSVDKKQIVSWSSPANRAMETAGIVIKAINLDKLITHEFIYSGNIDIFKKELEKVEDDMTLLVFGHEPTLSDWVEELTVETIKMKKGAMVSLSVTDKSPLKAEIEWQIKP